MVSQELSISKETEGAKKPLSYPIEIDKEILVWLLEMMIRHLPVLLLALKKATKSKTQPCYQEFKTSRGWLQKFSQRHGLALRTYTSISQKLSKQLEEKLPSLYEMSAKFIKIRKYLLAVFGNMNETPVFFDM